MGKFKNMDIVHHTLEKEDTCFEQISFVGLLDLIKNFEYLKNQLFSSSEPPGCNSTDSTFVVQFNLN